MNIYKYELEWKEIQTIKCKALTILDIQIQNGKPVMWAITNIDAEEKNIGIVMQGTGTDVFAIVDDLTYISTTQHEGFVWHWFTDFNRQSTSEYALEVFEKNLNAWFEEFERKTDSEGL